MVSLVKLFHNTLTWALYKIYFLRSFTALALKDFVYKDRLIFMLINLVLGKDEVGTLAGHF